MKLRKAFATGLLALAAFAGGSAEGVTLYGYVHQSIPPQSDWLVSVPVNNDILKDLSATSKTGSTLNFPAASFVAAAYNPVGGNATHYVRFITGPAAGLWSSITSNTATGITLSDAAVAALASGTEQIRVYKHHTLESVLPKKFDGIMLDSTPGAQTQVLTFSTADSRNKAPGSGFTASYINATAGWGPNANRPILPEQGFIIRNRSTTKTLTFVKSGIAPDHAVAYLIKGGVSRDTHLGTGYPTSVLLPNTNLGSVLNDQALFQPLAGQNNAPGSAGTFTYINVGAKWGPTGNVKLIPGNTAFIFRQPVGDAGGKRTVTKPY